jgi:hypothetical protein
VILADPSTHLEAVDGAGETHVDDRQRRLVGRDAVEAARAVAVQQHPESVVAQVGVEEIGDVVVVLDDDDGGLAVHDHLPPANRLPCELGRMPDPPGV